MTDEATSALDTVSRAQVHEAIRDWRKNKTTIIITHDLSPILSGDFVYVMRDGKIAEEGFRRELEAKKVGWFRQLARAQLQKPEDDSTDDIDQYYESEEVLDIPEVFVTPPMPSQGTFLKRLSASPGDLGAQLRAFKQTRRASQLYMDEQQHRRLSTTSTSSSFKTALLASPGRKDSTAFMATPDRKESLVIPTLAFAPQTVPVHGATSDTDMGLRRGSAISARGLDNIGLSPSKRRSPPVSWKASRRTDSWHQLAEVKVIDNVTTNGKGLASPGPMAKSARDPLSLLQICKIALPLIPNKLGLITGLICCFGAGTCTPMFSNLFSQLLAGLGNPGSINLTRTALLLLLIALLNGLADWGKYTILQHVAMGWILKLQEKSYSTIIKQDKAWFDQTENSSIKLVSILVKDAEDARNIIGSVFGNILVIISITMLGFIWALIKGWQLTLVGLAMGPLFVLSAAASSRILGKYEQSNKAQREECAKKFFQVRHPMRLYSRLLADAVLWQSVANVRAIRSMSLESAFLEKYEIALVAAYNGGKRSAFFTGFGSGIIFFTVYVTQGMCKTLSAKTLSRTHVGFLQRSCSW